MVHGLTELLQLWLISNWLADSINNPTPKKISYEPGRVDSLTYQEIERVIISLVVMMIVSYEGVINIMWYWPKHRAWIWAYCL